MQKASRKFPAGRRKLYRKRKKIVSLMPRITGIMIIIILMHGAPTS